MIRTLLLLAVFALAACSPEAVAPSEPLRAGFAAHLAQAGEGGRMRLDLAVPLQGRQARVIGDGPAAPLVCDAETWGPLELSARARVRIDLPDENLILMVFPADPARFPMNDIACEPGADGPVLRVRGVWRVIRNETPDRIIHQLRPVAADPERDADRDAWRGARIAYWLTRMLQRLG